MILSICVTGFQDSLQIFENVFLTEIFSMKTSAKIDENFSLRKPFLSKMLKIQLIF